MTSSINCTTPKRLSTPIDPDAPSPTESLSGFFTPKLLPLPIDQGATLPTKSPPKLVTQPIFFVPIDQGADSLTEKSVIYTIPESLSTPKSNAITQAALWIHNAAKNHPKSQEFEPFFARHAKCARIHTEILTRSIGSLINEALFLINSFFDTYGYHSLSDVQNQFLKKCEEGGINKWVGAPIEVLLKTFSTLISMTIGLGIITIGGLSIIFSKIAALLVSGCIYTLLFAADIIGIALLIIPCAVRDFVNLIRKQN